MLDKRYDNFREWNEEMLKKFDLEHYHDNASFIVRFIEGRRVKWILKFLEARGDDRVLEVGCGAGDILNKVRASERVGVDISDYILEVGRKRYSGIRFVKGDASDLPEEIKKDSYDKIFVSEVLEHVERPAKVFGQISEVAKDDSIIVVSIPNEKLINKIKSILQKLKLFDLFFSNLSRKMDDEWHLHSFDLDKLKDLVKDKFVIREVQGIPYNFLPLRYVVKMRLKN